MLKFPTLLASCMTVYKLQSKKLKIQCSHEAVISIFRLKLLRQVFCVVVINFVCLAFGNTSRKISNWYSTQMRLTGYNLLHISSVLNYWWHTHFSMWTIDLDFVILSNFERFPVGAVFSSKSQLVFWQFKCIKIKQNTFSVNNWHIGALCYAKLCVAVFKRLI